MSKIKIAHIAHSLGGVDVNIRLIVKNIDDNRFVNEIIHGENDTQKAFFDSNNKAVLEYKTNIVRNIVLIKDIIAMIDSYRFLKKSRPDIIHAHSAKGGVIGKVVGYFLGIQVFYTPHAFSYLSAENKLKRKLFLTIEKLLANKKTILLATSISEKNRAIEEVGYKPEQTFVLNNCIEPINSISPLTIKKSWNDEYICTVGRPSYQKNLELMIKILFEVKKTRKIHLVVMGIGYDFGQLESVKKVITELDMSNEVTLLEWTERSDVFNIISQCKFYISTSRYEGMPYAIIESLALSKPCLVTDCDGNIDLIEDGYNGFVIQNKDVNSFKNKIVKLLMDKELLNRLSENAYQSFATNYNIQNNISNLESIYIKYAKSF